MNTLKRFFHTLRSSGLVLNLRRIALPVALWFVLIAFAYQTQRDLFFRLAYLIVLVLLASLLWALDSVRALRVERKLLTPRTMVGKVAEEQLTVTNTGFFPKLFVEIRDDTAELPGQRIAGHRAGRVLSALAPRIRFNWTARTICRQRGRYTLGPLIASSGDPFGFFVFRRKIPNTIRVLTVFPLVVDLPNFAPPQGQLSGGEFLQRRTHFVTTNVSGTREYHPGDSFNRIHWPSSARHDRLIVKEFELDPSADVWIFLDLERHVHAGTWWEQAWLDRDLEDVWLGRRETARLAPNSEEYAVAAAASIAKHYLRQQRAVGFTAIGQKHEVLQPDRGERQLDRILETLAVLEAKGSMPFAHLLIHDSARLGRNITILAITPSSDPNWIQSAREIRRRGLHVIAVLVDVASFGGYGHTAGNAAQLMASGIPTYVIRQGDDLRAALSGRTLKQL